MSFTLEEIIKTWNAIYKTDIILEFEDFINALEDLEVEKENCKSEDCKNPVSTVDFHMGDAEREYCEKCYQEDDQSFACNYCKAPYDSEDCDCVYCCVCGEVNMTELTDNMDDTCRDCHTESENEADGQIDIVCHSD